MRRDLIYISDKKDEDEIINVAIDDRDLAGLFGNDPAGLALIDRRARDDGRKIIRPIPYTTRPDFAEWCLARMEMFFDFSKIARHCDLFVGYDYDDIANHFIFIGGDGFFVDHNQEVHYKNDYVLRELDGGYLLDRVNGQEVNQLFTSLDDAMQSICAAYSRRIELRLARRILEQKELSTKILYDEDEQCVMLIISSTSPWDMGDMFKNPSLIAEIEDKYRVRMLHGKETFIDCKHVEDAVEMVLIAHNKR